VSLKLTCSLSSSRIPAGAEPRLVYLLLEVNAQPQVGKHADRENDRQALPGNLAFVIDVSESMRVRLVTQQEFAELARNGLAQEVLTDGIPTYQLNSVPGEWVARLPRRIDSVIQALQVAGEYLRVGDRFSLIAFAGRAQCLIPAALGRERARLYRASGELETLNLGDGTEMANGMALALEQLNPANPSSSPAEIGSAARMILLTDGHTRNVSDCYSYARQAAQAGVKITTMGVGIEFNEDLLIPLADMTGGSAYYIETPGQLPDVFRKELGSALHVRYGDVEIKLRLAGGAELRRVYRVLPEMGLFDRGPEMDGSFSLLVGDFDPDTPVGLLAELVIPPARPGTYRIGQTMLAWDGAGDTGGADNTGGSEKKPVLRQNVRQDIILERAQSAAEQPDGRVMSFVEKAGAFRMGTQALEVAQAASQAPGIQQKTAATVRLRQAATRLLDMGESSLAGAMFQQAEMLEQNGSLDPDAMKKMRYATRRLTKNI
jgi:Ca-activated chloride channel homolog